MFIDIFQQYAKGYLVCFLDVVFSIYWDIPQNLWLALPNGTYNLLKHSLLHLIKILNLQGVESSKATTKVPDPQRMSDSAAGEYTCCYSVCSMSSII